MGTNHRTTEHSRARAALTHAENKTSESSAEVSSGVPLFVSAGHTADDLRLIVSIDSNPTEWLSGYHAASWH